MREAQKREILNFIKNLQKANEEIRQAVDQNNYRAVQNMLSECQDFAVSLEDIIERLEGKGHMTAMYLEEYCKILFQVFGKIGEEGVTGDEVYAVLNAQIAQIENSAREDIKAKKEVVFLPYKASMWDSLESIYLAAREDEDCLTYVIPIPYFDKNPDGSLGQMHYEGDEFPKNIPITSWKEYSIAQNKPDVIYIHNPYDDCNYVTSVHPAFYCRELKKYTEQLVYVPYFVLQEIDPDNQVAIDEMKHFITTPGVIYADKVIVQSENMKKIYVNEYLKFAKANGLGGKHTDRAYQEKRILGLGSPKIDKVLRTRKEDLEIPEEWMKIIRKPDGSWKKIIFYNTSVTALLENNEKMLDKMEDVFRIFQENREQVALLWRPHPLIESTVKSMRPQLWERYEKLIEQYKKEGWGIYDDTPDMDRAVVLSDAYYGDGSSVVQIYQALEKPILIQYVG